MAKKVITGLTLSRGRVVALTKEYLSLADVGGRTNYANRLVSSDSTLTVADRNVDVDCSGGALTVTLPPAAALANGEEITITKVDDGPYGFTLAPAGAETFSGYQFKAAPALVAAASSLTVDRRFGSVTLFARGGDWRIKASVDGVDVWNPVLLGVNWAVVTPGVNVWQDTAATTPALADTDPVVRLDLDGPDGLSFVSTGYTSPTLVNPSGSIWAVRFNGSSMALRCSTNYQPDPATVFFAGKYDTGGTPNPRFYGFGSTRSVFYGRDQDGGDDFWYYNDQAVTVRNTGFHSNSLSVFTARLETGVNRLPRQNGVNGASNVKCNNAPTERPILGASNAAGEYGAIDLEAFGVGGTILSDSDCLLVERFLNTRGGYGLTI